MASLLLLPALACAQTNFVWTGNNATIFFKNGYADGTSAGNWQGNTLPTSNGTNSTITFGATGNLTGPDATVSVVLPAVDVAGITFTDASPNYTFFGSGLNATIGLGASGLTTGFSGSSIQLYNSIQLNLLASQTWNINSPLYLYSSYSSPAITEENPGTILTKTGIGELFIYGNSSTFTGGFVLAGGTLSLSDNGIGSPGDMISGPVGTGTLTLGSGTTLRSVGYGDLQILNRVNLGSDVTLDTSTAYGGLQFMGDVTLAASGSTVRLNSENAMFFAGAIGNAPRSTSSFTVTKAASAITTTQNSGNSSSNSNSLPIAVLAGNNTYTGGTIADGAGIVFFTPESLPAYGAVLALNGGYLGTGFSGGGNGIISRVASPGLFNGSIGLDTNPDLSSTPTEFSDFLNLSAFTPDAGNPTAGFWGLGTQTFAKLTSTSSILPPTGGNYVFGGGNGTLYVATNLGVATNSPGAGVRVRSEFGERPITVYFQGNNTYVGNLMSDHSIVVLDAPTALPATSNFSLDAEAYVGYTENTGWTPAQFVARLQPGAYNNTSVLGFDYAPTNANHGRDISFLNLSSLSDIYVGTSTHVHFTEGIRAPSSGMLSVTGVNGGWLNLDGPLTSTYGAINAVPGITSLRVGLNGVNDLYNRSYVEITNATNNFTGGTTLTNGYLLLGASSITSGNTLVSGPLGTGVLTFAGSSENNHSAALVASVANVTLRNDITFSNQSSAQFGVGPAQYNDDPASALSDYQSNNLALTGNLSGTGSDIRFVGSGTFALTGNNAGLHADRIEIGSLYNSGGTRLIAGHANALGDSNTAVVLQPGSDLQFANGGTPTTFRVGAFYSDSFFPSEGDKSFLVLGDGDTLVINQFVSGTLHAALGGLPADWVSAATTASSASLVKNGSGLLRLTGSNNLTGGLTVNSGIVYFASQASANVGNIVLNGGGVATGGGVTLSNNLTFGSAGGTIGGNGTFTMPIAITNNVTLSPGSSPGTTTFANDLTFAGGGSYLWEIQSGYNGGYDTDFANVTGKLLVTATSANRFTFRLSTLDATGANGALASWDPSQAYSWSLVAANSISGYDSNAFNLDVTQFASPLNGGSFSLLTNGNSLTLAFTPIPEPSTYALFALGLGAVALTLRRRRRS